MVVVCWGRGSIPCLQVRLVFVSKQKKPILTAYRDINKTVTKESMESKKSLLTFGAVVLMVVSGVGIFETVKPWYYAQKKRIITELIEDEIKDTYVMTLIRQKQIIKGKEVIESDFDFMQRGMVVAINRLGQCEAKLTEIKIALE